MVGGAYADNVVFSVTGTSTSGQLLSNSSGSVAGVSINAASGAGVCGTTDGISTCILRPTQSEGGCAAAAYYVNGALCHDSLTDILYIGNGITNNKIPQLDASGYLTDPIAISVLDASLATPGNVIPWSVGTASVPEGSQGEGVPYWESDADILTIGTSGGTVTLAKVDSPIFTGYIEAPYLILGSAATAADAGTIRLPNAATIQFEADGAGTDINALSVDSSEVIQIGTSGASGVTITPSLSSITMADSATITFDEAAANPDDADVVISGADGVLKIATANGANNEDITIDLDATANTATVASTTGVTSISMPSIILDSPVKNQEVLIDCNGSADPYAYCTSANASTLTAKEAYRTLINSYGRGEAQTVTLPAAAAGMTFIALVGTQHNSAWKIQRAGSDTITWSAGGTDTANKTYFQETNQAVGARVSCITYKTGASAWTWLCEAVTGTWVTD